jgi:hypothetical protein
MFNIWVSDIEKSNFSFINSSTSPSKPSRIDQPHPLRWQVININLFWLWALKWVDDDNDDMVDVSTRAQNN